MNEYLNYLNQELPKPRLDATSPLALDLFAGCGGLALGFEAAGFRTIGYEMLPEACETYRSNLSGECRCEKITTDTEYNCLPQVIIGGPPCQPFSVGGLQLGKEDQRNGFPAFLASVAKFSPKVAIFENVQGMLYRGRGYFQQILRHLEQLNYVVEYRILRAVDYGVPQRRERLFVVAHRGEWHFPEAITGKHFTAGDAVRDLVKRNPANAKFLTASMDAYVARYEKASKCIRPRDLHFDKPSRTITCRNLDGATGDMMRVRLEDGRRRRLTVREGARLQSFPDWFTFEGNESDQFNQIGNAVPPLLGKAVAKAAWECLSGPALADRAIRDRRLEIGQQLQLLEIA